MLWRAHLAGQRPCRSQSLGYITGLLSAFSSASELYLHSCCCKRLLHECLQDKGRAAVSSKGFCMRTQGPALPTNMQQGGS